MPRDVLFVVFWESKTCHLLVVLLHTATYKVVKNVTWCVVWGFITQQVLRRDVLVVVPQHRKNCHVTCYSLFHSTANIVLWRVVRGFITQQKLSRGVLAGIL